MHPKPDKPKDYLSEVIKHKAKKMVDGNSNTSLSFDVNNILSNKDLNITESMLVAKSRIEAMDNKIMQKQEFIKLNDGYMNDPNLVGNYGKLLLDSMNAKLKILSKLK